MMRFLTLLKVLDWEENENFSRIQKERGFLTFLRLYFPLVNEAGMMSAITPLLHGDVKTGQNTFGSKGITPPGCA